MDGDSFFAKGAGASRQSKRRRDGGSKSGSSGGSGGSSSDGGGGGGGRGADRRRAAANVDSGDEDSDAEAGPAVQDSDEEDDSETAAEKRLRLAKEFISRIEDEERDKVDGHDVDAEAIAHRLRDDLSNEKGILSRNVAKHIAAGAAAAAAPTDEGAAAAEGAGAADAGAGGAAVSDGRQVLRFKGQPVTCMVLSADAKYVFCGSKCGTIVQWSLATGEKLVEHERAEETDSTQKQGGGKVYERHGNDRQGAQGHTAEILALAITSDGKMLASGGRDRRIIIWDTIESVLLRVFTGHRDAVASLAFRRRTHQLFSGSLDRTIKIWNLDQMAYVETLYGHQDCITSMDSLDKDRVVTAGARDRSLRLWKVVEESQLVFQGKPEMGSVDCVAMITEAFFLSGSEDGTLAVWDAQKKRPLAQVKSAHGENNWITAVAALKYGDVAASGSCDGQIKLWKCVPKVREFTFLLSIPVVGFVNALSFDTHGSILSAAVAQEPKLGRWQRIKKARNGVVVFTLFDKDKLTSDALLARKR